MTTEDEEFYNQWEQIYESVASDICPKCNKKMEYRQESTEAWGVVETAQWYECEECGYGKGVVK